MKNLKNVKFRHLDQKNIKNMQIYLIVLIFQLDYTFVKCTRIKILLIHIIPFNQFLEFFLNSNGWSEDEFTFGMTGILNGSSLTITSINENY